MRNYRVFIASPGDVQEERDAMARVVDHVNRTDGRKGDYLLEAVRLETLDVVKRVELPSLFRFGPQPGMLGPMSPSLASAMMKSLRLYLPAQIRESFWSSLNMMSLWVADVWVAG